MSKSQPSKHPIAVNARVLQSRLSGVQRYTSELLSRFGSRLERLEPSHARTGPAGHAWEQLVLPARLRGRLLWSPANTGPLMVGQQVLTLHDLAPLDCPEGFQRRFVSWYRWLLPRLVPRVRRVITDSRFVKERLTTISGIPPERVTVVPLGASARFHPCKPDEISHALARLHLPTPHYLLALGSLEPRKNLAVLLEVWKVLQKTLPDEIWLVVAGTSGSPRVFRELRLPSLPARVHLTGYVEDALLPPLYSGALAFVFISAYEGFGLPPLEAMACGTAVVVSDRTALPEVTGEAALLVDPGDPEAIGSALRSLVEDASLRDRMEARSRARARLYTWERTAEETWRILVDSAG